MASIPSFYATPRAKSTLISSANTARDGTGTILDCFAAGSNGSKIERIIVQAIAATTSGMVRLFLHNGTSAFLWREVPVSAITPGGAVQAFRDEVDGSRTENVLILPPGWSLRVSTHNAESFHITAIGGDA